jgi:hypothetical protein
VSSTSYDDTTLHDDGSHKLPLAVNNQPLMQQLACLITFVSSDARCLILFLHSDEHY